MPGRAAAAALLAVMTVGCADPSDPSKRPPETSSTAGAPKADVAPECKGAEPLVAEPGEGPEPAAPLRLAARIEQWGAREAPDSFAGVWLDDDVMVVGFATDVDRYARAVRELFDPGLAVARARHSFAELQRIQDDLSTSARQGDSAARGAIRSTSVDVVRNRTTVGVFDPTREHLAELSRRYRPTAICFEIEAPPERPTARVTPLAKVEGWRPGLEVGNLYAVFEVAYDRATAEQAWRDNVPAALQARNDELPAEPGRYATLDDVDFDRQVVVVWSTGESGSCPEWITDITTVQNEVRVATDATAEVCTSDYNPYRMLVAVDRDRVPAAGDVDRATLDLEVEPDTVVSAYPYGG